VNTRGNNNLAVVVPTFNRKDITVQFVKKLNSQPVPLRIYVSDSGSTDGTASAVVAEPNVRLVSAGPAAWWSAAVNRGIEEAKKDGADVFLVMNDDIEFDQNLISQLLASHFEHPGCILSPLQRTDSGEFVGTCYEGVFRRVRHLASIPEDGLVETSNGCCLLIPLATFNAVGFFDENNCPHLYGDTEFQLRAMKAGFPTRPCDAVAIRQMSATNYFGRLGFTSLFTFKGSPLHFRAYGTFGKTLFGSRFRFAVLGLRFHFDFLKVLFKILKFLTNNRMKVLKARYAKS
jgi:GT2 family glycosyltransferase